MAHFAKIETDGSVSQVIVVKNCAIGGCIGPDAPDYLSARLVDGETVIDGEAHRDCGDLEFPDTEPLGATFCAELFGGTWIQTSYSGSFRGRFAGVGMKYDKKLDEFLIVSD